MDFAPIESAFEKIGADVIVRPARRFGWWDRAPIIPVRINVERLRGVETFTLTVTDEADLRVLNTRPDDRHLLLWGNDARFLCGHDERHWFVAGIRDRVSTVRDAKASLMPVELRPVAERTKHGDRRRNAAYIRQGEWFFAPASNARLATAPILINEPLMRPRGKPHMCDEVIRFGGEVVHLIGQEEVADRVYRARVLADAEYAKRPRRTVTKNPEVYVRGRVRHDDHATIVLKGWHRVHMNNEFTTGAVTFYD